MAQTSISRGDVVGAYLSTTFPSLFTRNLVKFHLMPSPNKPPFSDFRNLNSGAAFSPFTSIYTSQKISLNNFICLQTYE